MPRHECLLFLDHRDETINLRVSKEEAVDVASLAARLVSCPSQRVISRAVYAEEYEESLRQCMKGTPTVFAVQHSVLRRGTIVYLSPSLIFKS